MFNYIVMGYFRKKAMWAPNKKGWHIHIGITFLFSQQNKIITKTYFCIPGSSIGTTTTKSFNNSNRPSLALLDILLTAATHLLQNVEIFEDQF